MHFVQNSSIIISHGRDKDSFVSQLSISNASYLDTGYYYCDPFDDESNDEDNNNSTKYIYLYVQSKYFF